MHGESVGNQAQQIGCNAQKFYNAVTTQLGATQQDLGDYNFIKKHLTSLKNIYQAIGKSVNGITRINVNSLMVLSFPAKRKDKVIIKNHIIKIDRASLCNNNVYDDFPPSCLYIGDTILIRNKICDYFCKTVGLSCQILNLYSYVHDIGMMQIPHHGSKNCYNQSISKCKHVESAFLNCNKRKSKNFSNILNDFILGRIPLFLVDTQPFVYQHKI